MDFQENSPKSIQDFLLLTLLAVMNFVSHLTGSDIVLFFTGAGALFYALNQMRTYLKGFTKK